MTPLQQAAQAVIDRWNLPAFTNAGDIAALEKALEAEQAQAVEPVWYFCSNPAGDFSYQVSQQAGYPDSVPLYLHPALPPAETMKNGAHRWINLDLLGAIAGALSRAKNAPNILEKVRGLIKLDGGVGRGHDAPYPGMIEAFEAHYGQSFTDKDWRNETGIWAAAWSCAVRQSAPPAMRLSELLAEKGIALQKTFVEKPRDHVPDATKIINEPYDQQALELCNECGWKAIMPGEPCFVCNMKTEAQQVAVPMTDDQIEAACRFIEPSLDGPIAYDLLIARAIEKHHGIGAKLVTKPDSRPQNCGSNHCSCIECPYPKPDWSAA